MLLIQRSLKTAIRYFHYCIDILTVVATLEYCHNPLNVIDPAVIKDSHTVFSLLYWHFNRSSHTWALPQSIKWLLIQQSLKTAIRYFHYCIDILSPVATLEYCHNPLNVIDPAVIKDSHTVFSLLYWHFNRSSHTWVLPQSIKCYWSSGH